MAELIRLRIQKRYVLLLLPVMLCLSLSGWGQAQDSISKPKKFGLFGSIGFGTQFYSNLEGAARNRPGTWMISGSPVVRMFGYDAPLSFTLSEQDRSFQQPFNLMGFSPRFKWATIHLGFRSLHLSNYTLSGIPVLGVGVELNPGKLRLAAQYGRFNRAVSKLDSLGAFGIGNRLSFARWGYAAKVGFGSRSSYFDLIFLKAWDDSSSITRSLSDSVRLNPAENVVIGFNTRWQFSPTLALEADAAYSAYTGDVREAVNEESGWNQNAGFLLKQRLSTSLTGAGRVALSYSHPIFGLQLEYRQVAPDYRSMGIFFVQSDIEQYLVSPSIGLFRQRLRLSGSVGLQADNIQRNRAATTQTLISSAMLSLSPGNGAYGIDLAYSNFGINQRPGLQRLSDTIRLAQNNHSVNLTQRLSSRGGRFNRNWFLIAGYQELQDLNRFTAEASQNKNLNLSLSYQQSPSKGRGFSWQMALVYNAFETIQLQYSLAGLSGNVSKAFFKNTLSTSLNSSYQVNNTNGQQAGGVWNAGCAIRYSPSRRHSFSFNGTYINSTNNQVKGQDFAEIFGSLDYRFTF